MESPKTTDLYKINIKKSEMALIELELMNRINRIPCLHGAQAEKVVRFPGSLPAWSSVPLYLQSRVSPTL